MIHVFNLVVLSPFGAYIGHVVAYIRHFVLLHSVIVVLVHSVSLRNRTAGRRGRQIACV